MPHHEECWEENDGCTTFGCKGTIPDRTRFSDDHLNNERPNHPGIRKTANLMKALVASLIVIVTLVAYIVLSDDSLIELNESSDVDETVEDDEEADMEDITNYIGENEISITIVNNTEEIMISYILFYGDDLDEWGEDLLGDDEIPPGEEKIFIVPEGEYTVIPMTYNYFLLPAARNVSEDYVLEIGEEDKFPIQVTNAKEEVDIGFIYLSPSDSEDWGEDWLGDEVLPAGTTRYFFAEESVYDLLVLDLEGEPILDEYDIEFESEKHFVIE